MEKYTMFIDWKNQYSEYKYVYSNLANNAKQNMQRKVKK